MIEVLSVKRVYDRRESNDGIRILVDRLWPRGLTRERAGIDEWAKHLAPSDELRRWFGHDAGRWLEFRQRYIKELSSPQQSKLLEEIAQKAVKSNITIVFGTKDVKYNNARVLEELISKRMRDITQDSSKK